MRKDSFIKLAIFTVLFTFTVSAHADYIAYPVAVMGPCGGCVSCCQPIIYMDLTPKYHKVKHRKKACGTYIVRHKTTPCGAKRVSRTRVYYPDMGFRVMYVQPIRSYNMEYRDMDRRTGDDDTADLQISN